MNKFELDPEDDFEVNDLAYDNEKGTFVNDVNDPDADWDHPANYSTISLGAKNDDSSYDMSNPYVGSEYANREELFEEDLESEGMRIRDAKSLKLSTEDKELSKNEEDSRLDLDEEGYPKRDD